MTDLPLVRRARPPTIFYKRKFAPIPRARSPTVVYERKFAESNHLLSRLKGVTQLTASNRKEIVAVIKGHSYLSSKLLVKLAVLCTSEAKSELVLEVVECVIISYRNNRVPGHSLVVFLNSLLANFSLQEARVNDETSAEATPGVIRELLLMICGDLVWDAILTNPFHPAQKEKFTSDLCISLLKTFVRPDVSLMKKTVTLRVVARAMQDEFFVMKEEDLSGFSLDDITNSLVKYLGDVKRSMSVVSSMVEPLYVVLAHNRTIVQKIRDKVWENEVESLVKDMCVSCTEFCETPYINREKLIDISGHTIQKAQEFIKKKF